MSCQSDGCRSCAVPQHPSQQRAQPPPLTTGQRTPGRLPVFPCTWGACGLSTGDHVGQVPRGPHMAMARERWNSALSCDVPAVSGLRSTSDWAGSSVLGLGNIRLSSMVPLVTSWGSRPASFRGGGLAPAPQSNVSVQRACSVRTLLQLLVHVRLLCNLHRGPQGFVRFADRCSPANVGARGDRLEVLLFPLLELLAGLCSANWDGFIVTDSK